MRKTNVAIIGAGEIGRAIDQLMDAPSVSVDLWDAQDGKVQNQKSLEAVVSRAHVIFFCVPSWVLAQAVASCAPYLNARTIVVSISKGIEGTTQQLTDAFWPSVLPAGQPFVLLAGPMLAQEIYDGRGASATIASKSQRISRRVAALFGGKNLRCDFTRDVHGTALASVLKNIYSVAMGIANGLAWGGNRQGWLASRAIQEMFGLMKDLGGKKETLFLSAGLPDFLATGYSDCSHNRSSGRTLVTSGVKDVKSEGTVSIAPLVRMLGDRVSLYPLLIRLERILVRHEAPESLFESFFHEEDTPVSHTRP